MSGDKDEIGEFASPACLMHEGDPAYMGLSPTASGDERANIMRWRKAQRSRLIASRLAISSDDRAAHDRNIAAHLDSRLPALDGKIVSLYWPLRGEPDLRPWLGSILNRGAVCALPLVVEKNAPLVFRTWRPGQPLTRGFWNILVPEGGGIVTPDIVLAPVVGMDEDRFRFGYGGGYFDRTLASFAAKPLVIGVGYSQARIKTIYPLGHDIPMDALVTECGVRE
jgi:5-formyltetrahydrofolate cyclo-ligase